MLDPTGFWNVAAVYPIVCVQKLVMPIEAIVTLAKIINGRRIPMVMDYRHPLAEKGFDF